MNDMTVEQLKTAIRRAANCDNATIPAHQIAPLLELALQAAGAHNYLTLKRLQKKSGEAEEVELTGDEIRLILDLALRAKLWGYEPSRPHLKVVPPSDKKA